MEKIILDTPDLKVAQETGDGQPVMHFQIRLHLPSEWYETIPMSAQSAGVSIEEYVTECAKDGLARGYR